MGSNPAVVSETDEQIGASLDRSLGDHLRQLADSMTASFHQQVDAKGVNQGQWRYLRELWEEDRLTQRELGERVGRQGATMVTAVRSLESAGFVRIEKNEADLRRNRICLTALGRRTWEALAPLIEHNERAALAGLTEKEVKIFSRLLVRIQRNVDRQHRGRNSWALQRTAKFAEQLDD